MKTNKKVALILHGWPQPVEEGTSNYIYKTYFEKKGYQVIAPNLFNDNFTINVDRITRILNGYKPRVVVGISFGGLLAAKIAKVYPKAKLVLIATGPKVAPKSIPFKILIYLAKYKYFLKVAKLFMFIPDKILHYIYMSINPFDGNELNRESYLRDMQNNIKYMSKISVNKELELINFISTIDNTELLKTLENETLIFLSKNDSMMPADGSESLINLIPNNKAIINNNSHFEVFTKRNFKDLDNFIN